MTVQCFFSTFSSSSIDLRPSLYLATYLVNAFFLDLYLRAAGARRVGSRLPYVRAVLPPHPRARARPVPPA